MPKTCDDGNIANFVCGTFLWKKFKHMAKARIIKFTHIYTYTHTHVCVIVLQLESLPHRIHWVKSVHSCEFYTRCAVQDAHTRCCCCCCCVPACCSLFLFCCCPELSALCTLLNTRNCGRQRAAVPFTFDVNVRQLSSSQAAGVEGSVWIIHRLSLQYVCAPIEELEGSGRGVWANGSVGVPYCFVNQVLYDNCNHHHHTHALATSCATVGAVCRRKRLNKAKGACLK